MITQVIFPTSDALEPLRKEALSEQEPAQLIDKHVKSISSLIVSNPVLYRAYGPYWWSVKQLLRNNGVDFGEDDEPTTREHVNYTDPVDLLCAASVYQEFIVESGGLENNIHQFTTSDDEPFDYSLEDNDLEEMIFVKSL